MFSTTAARPLHQACPCRKLALPACISQAVLVSVTLWSSPVVRAADGVEEIIVEETRRPLYQIEQSSLGKLTERLQDTPQSITALTEELMDDRGVMSLNDALRNVPGITLGAGEFTWQGNNPTIRGFNSRNDIFLDGMRDYGSYSRDPFNLEAIEVLQGPSSMVFGRGSTGGVINQSSKRPEAEEFRKLHVNMGSADTLRATADLNQPLPTLGDHSGLRLNVVQHTNAVPARDVTESDHWGLAPTLALDLGDATLLTLSYLKQQGDSIPDYGLPWLQGAPAPVARDTFYGFASDYLKTDAAIANLRVEHRFSDDVNLTALVRQADYDRRSRITEPLIPSGVTAATPLTSININRNVFNGESTESMLQAQLNLVANVQTGFIRHALVTGVETAEESSSPIMRLGVGVPSTTLVGPQPQVFSATRLQVRANANTDSDSVAAYVLDTLKFGEHWQVVAGARWDSFATNYIADRYDANGVTAGQEQILRKDIETSYRAALVYKPADTLTYYLGWGTSFNPSAEGLSFIANARNFGISNAFLEPEQNESIEVGAKWSVLDERLQLETALFQIEKSNARVPDPGRPGFNALAGEQQVQGLSLNVSGSLLPDLLISGGYTYLDSEEVKTAPGLDNLGRPLLNVAKNNFSLWLNYAVTTDLEFGAGARFVDERLARNVSPINRAPRYWAYDAMSKYSVNEHVTVKLSITNLTDELYYDQLHPFHVVPGAGLAGVFALNLDY
jgi:catecholate siderophore receptor